MILRAAASRPLAQGRRRGARARLDRERRRWWLWLLPAAGLTLLFTVYPAFGSVRLSLYDWAGYGPKTYTGGANYRDLWHDGTFHTALWNTITFAFVTAIGTVAIGTALALYISRRGPLSRTLKALIFMPVILPIVFTGLVWVFGLDTDFGWVNNVLDSIHRGWGQGWLSNPSLVMWTIDVTTILQFTGLPMIIVLAALEDLPKEVDEAAMLDGAYGLRRARDISLPLVRDVILTITLLQIMYGFKIFDQVFVMTNGGPGRSSEVLSTYVYREAFVLQHFGLGAAGAVVTCVVVVVVSMVYLSIFRTGKIGRA
jgi:raffinose/stachyose/melibiose transport system permease protein